MYGIVCWFLLVLRGGKLGGADFSLLQIDPEGKLT